MPKPHPLAFAVEDGIEASRAPTSFDSLLGAVRAEHRRRCPIGPFVHVDDGDHPWMTWTDWLAEFGISLQRQPGRVLFHNYPMVLQQALAGRGVALGWRNLTDELVAGDAQVVVGPEASSSRSH